MTVLNQTITAFAGHQPLDAVSNDYLFFFNADIKNNLDGYFVGNKWDNEFGFGLLLSNLSIPKDAHISSAKFWIERSTSSNPDDIFVADDDVVVNLLYEDTDDATNFSDQADFDSRAKTAIKEVISKLDEIDIVEIIREITTRAGWISGQNACLFFEHDQARWQAHYDEHVEDLSLFLQNDGSAIKEFKIEIEWCFTSDLTSKTVGPVKSALSFSTGVEKINYAMTETTDTFDLTLGNSEFAGYQKATTMDWYLNTSGTSFKIGEEVSPDPQLSMVALQYKNITLLKNKTIISAKLRLPTELTYYGGGPYKLTLAVTIKYEDTDSAANFSDQTNFDARSKSAASISETLEATVASSVWVDDPHGGYWVTTYHAELDITTLMQAILNRAGWASGNNVSFYIESAATAGDIFYIYNDDSNYFHLDITYAQEPPHIEYLDPAKIGLKLSGSGSPGVSVQNLDPAKIAIDMGANIHTGADMVEPTPYSIVLSDVVPYGFETFDPIQMALSFSAGETVEFDTTGNVRLIYYASLTGYQNGLDDIIMSISSFQATLRTGAQSYLSVVIPGIEYADDIVDRADGDIRIIMAQKKNGEIINSEEIARVHLDNPSDDKGAVNKSITLSGHMQETFTPKTIKLENGTYKRTTNGKKRIRFPHPEIYLKPGDTVVYGNDEFVADIITIYMSSIHQQMEVTEQ